MRFTSSYGPDASSKDSVGQIGILVNQSAHVGLGLLPRAAQPCDSLTQARASGIVGNEKIPERLSSHGEGTAGR